MDWTFFRGITYGLALGLLLSALGLNIAGEFWPGESVLACFTNPAGTSVQRTASF